MDCNLSPTSEPAAANRSDRNGSQRLKRCAFFLVIFAVLAVGGIFLRDFLKNREIEHFLAKYQARGGKVVRFIKTNAIGNNYVGYSLRRLLGKKRVSWITERKIVSILVGASVEEDEYHALSLLAGLEVLGVSKTRLTPKIIHLLRGKDLCQLSLEDSEATDEMVKELCDVLRDYPRLEELRLGNTAITGVGMRELQRLQHLQRAHHKPGVRDLVIKLDSPLLQGSGDL